MNDYAPSYHDNQLQRSPCLLVLDISACMAAPMSGIGTTGIEALKEGLAVLREELQKDLAAQHRVQFSIVQAGGPGDEPLLLLDWVDAADFRPPELQEGGNAGLPAAMRLALHHVEQHKQHLRRSGITYTRPWIMVVSSGVIGGPRSLWETVAADCRQAERDKRCVIFPIVLDDADSSGLQRMSTARVASLSTTRFSEYFRWLSAGLASTSRSAPGVSVALPPVDSWTTFRT
jgi:uncharacterized protein YegL